MQNFNAPKKGNKSVVELFVAIALLLLIAALIAVYFDQDEVKTCATDSVETQVAPAIYCTRGRRYLCAQSDDIA